MTASVLHRGAAPLKDWATRPRTQDGFKRWFDASPIYSGPVAANRLGWQVVRTVAKRGAISTRRRLHAGARPDRWTTALQAEGFVVIPDYLPAEAFSRVRDAYEEYGQSDRVRDIGTENGTGITYRSGPVLRAHDGDGGSVINDLFGASEELSHTAGAVIGRRIRPPLRVVYQELSLADGQVDDTDREQVLHADKAYPCVKAIYAVDAVTEGASPFHYCPGSHRMTVDRLQYEYDMSIRDARLRGGQVEPADGDFAFERSRYVMGQDYRRRLGIRERALTCAPNSLILVNNAGFHRRGVLEPGHHRRTLWINFYEFQRPWYGKAAFRAAKSVIDTDDVSRELADVHRQ